MRAFLTSQLWRTDRIITRTPQNKTPAPSSDGWSIDLNIIFDLLRMMKDLLRTDAGALDAPE